MAAKDTKKAETALPASVAGASKALPASKLSVPKKKRIRRGKKKLEAPSSLPAASLARSVRKVKSGVPENPDEDKVSDPQPALQDDRAGDGRENSAESGDAAEGVVDTASDVAEGDAGSDDIRIISGDEALQDSSSSLYWPTFDDENLNTDEQHQNQDQGQEGEEKGSSHEEGAGLDENLDENGVRSGEKSAVSDEESAKVSDENESTGEDSEPPLRQDDRVAAVPPVEPIVEEEPPALPASLTGGEEATDAESKYEPEPAYEPKSEYVPMAQRDTEVKPEPEYKAPVKSAYEYEAESDPEPAPEPVASREPEKPEFEEADLNPQEMPEPVKVAELEAPRKSLSESLFRVAEQIWPIISGVFNVRVLAGLAGAGVLVWGLFFVFSQGYHEQLLRMLPGQQGTEVQQSEPSEEEVLNPEESRGSENIGAGVIPQEVGAIRFFARLLDPRVTGETGLTALSWYSQLKDEADQINQFVTYVDFVRELRNLVRVDVYDLLNDASLRSEALDEYTNRLQQSRVNGRRYLADIHLLVDDLTLSYQSLTPDRQQFENDFFTSLEDLQGSKSDTLLKGFVDASQKQVALRARISALEKLVEYYTVVLERLSIRIEAVERNRDALVGGIQVVDIPGDDLNVIVPAGEAPVTNE